MNEIHTIRTPGGDKIGLLGLFALSLLVARFTVAWKTAILFSEPIRLPHAGLSVAMPSGNGWQSSGQWEYRENTFIISSIFALSSGKPSAWAHCQYRLGTEKTEPKVQFEWKASEVDGEIVETGQTQLKALTVDWVRIERPEILFTTFWGIARLPNERRLDIEVHQIMSDPVMSERVFKRVMESLSYEGHPLLEAGVEVASAIRSKGLDSYLGKQGRQDLFLIKDSSGRSLGFTMDLLVNSSLDAQWSVRGASFLYLGGVNTQEQETTFRCSNNLDEFTYTSELYLDSGRRSSEVVMDKPGVMTVKQISPQMQMREYHLGSAALPDICFDLIFEQMLDCDTREVVVDIIDATGKIVPTYISRVDVENNIVAEPDAAFIFDLTYLDGRDFSHQLYLDEQKRIYRSLIHQENTYVLDRTSKENIVKEFPEFAQRIMRSSRMLR